MNVLLVSQCNKRALTQTRRILDQFAERRGERTWQTPITQEGLDTLRRLLKKTARKNTAVACHWIRGRDHSELAWVVGNAARFNALGAVPTNSTTRNVLRKHDENDWHTLGVIGLLAQLAGLLHDLGKACDAFQTKLHAGKPVRDAYRHEWVSLRMFQAFVGAGDDDDWLGRFAAITPQSNPAWLKRLVRDGLDEHCDEPFSSLPDLAQAIGWLVVSHHFLPQSSDGNRTRLKHLLRYVGAGWNRCDPDACTESIKSCWSFEHGTPFASAQWCRRVRKVAQRIQAYRDIHTGGHWLDDPYVAHASRLCVMLADHHYSSLPLTKTQGDEGFALFANTDRETGACKQPLDDHLLGVGRGAGEVAHRLPALARELPRVARFKAFSRRTTDRSFAWQDKAYDCAAAMRERAVEQGFFGINMASTGCGKTLANARILYALANPQQGTRISVALGLRSLTLQTGQAYRSRLKLDADDLAIRVGGAGVKALFEHAQLEASAQADHSKDSYNKTGSVSAESLDDADGHVRYEGSLTTGTLSRWLQGSRDARALVEAPMLVSTIDHLVPATEGTRGGRQIAPMLRLMTSDLVLDEVDDFDIDDLPAVSRLVHWAGMLGSRVLLSSATLPPALVEGLFVAYLQGRCIYQRNRGVPGARVDVCCGWFDEHTAKGGVCSDVAAFATQHERFVAQRLKAVAKQPIRRKAEIVPVLVATQDRERLAESWAAQLPPLMTRLHAAHHCVDPKSGKRLSVGLVYMANIDPLIDTVRHLLTRDAPAGHQFHLCCYHSRFPLLMRSAIENRLDRLLDRHSPDALFDDPDMRALLDASDAQDHVLAVMATSVATVGRDHDYDWAIVEPSSMRLIIQLAGRIKRHRDEPCESANVLLLGTSLRALKNPGGVAYNRPGFEGAGQWQLRTHQLTELLALDQYTPITAAPRIVERSPLQPQRNLVDLEHARLRAQLCSHETPGSKEIGTDSWWSTRAHLGNVLQQLQPFRKQHDGPQAAYVLLPDEDGDWRFERIERYGEPTSPQDALVRRVEAPVTATSLAWPRIDYLKELERVAELDDISLERAAMRYGTIDLPEGRAGQKLQQWRYSPELGFRREPSMETACSAVEKT